MADTISPEKIKALIAELRQVADKPVKTEVVTDIRGRVVGHRLLDPPVWLSLEERAADALETLLLSHTDAVTAWEEGREACKAKLTETAEHLRRRAEKTRKEWAEPAESEEDRRANYADARQDMETARRYDEAARTLAAIQPPASLGAPEQLPAGIQKDSASTSGEGR